MPVRYYNESDIGFPSIMRAIANRVLYYLATTLYPNEDPDSLIDPTSTTQKFILANFDSSPEVAIHRAIEELQQTSSALFPFTAYTFSEETLEINTKSHLQVSGKIFDSVTQSYIQAIPAAWEIPCVTFANNIQDYFRIRQMLSADACKLTRVQVPLLVNNALISFPIDIDFELTKGTYSYQYEEYLSHGNIYDLMHTLKIKFLYFLLTDAIVSLVDNIAVSLNTLATTTQASKFIQNTYSPITPVINSTVPATGSVNVDKTQNIIINFNVAMNEGITNSYIDIEPMFPCNFMWNDSSTQLTLPPQSGMLGDSTNYVITIEKNAQSIDQASLIDDYILSFTTGV